VTKGTWTNCRGTSKRQKKCSVCGPWKDHWAKKSKKKFPKKCKVKYHDGKTWVNCNNDAAVGAHVRNKSKSKSNNQYIVPACYGCNKRGGKKKLAKFQLQTVIVSAVQCHTKAFRVNKKSKNKTIQRKFSLPGRKSAPPKGFKLKSGYRCRKVKGRRKYWTKTGRKTYQRNACSKI